MFVDILNVASGKMVDILVAEENKKRNLGILGVGGQARGKIVGTAKQAQLSTPHTEVETANKAR